MFWNLFGNTNQKNIAEGVSPAVQPVYFNVMPKNPVVSVPAKAATESVLPKQVQPPPVPVAGPVLPVVSEKLPVVPAVSAPVAQPKSVLKQEVKPTVVPAPLPEPAKIFPSAPAVHSETSGKTRGRFGPKQLLLVVVIFIFLALAGAVTLFTIGKHTSAGESLRNLYDKFFSRAAPPVVLIPPVQYSTAEDWRVRYFGQAESTESLDEVDPDSDGMNNLEEFTAGTEPKNPDTDGDGLADGDEFKIFGCLPANAHSGENLQYTDGDGMAGGWDCLKVNGLDALLSPERVIDISQKLVQFGLHEPSPATLGAEGLARFVVTAVIPAPLPSSVDSLPEGLDTAPEAMLERDVQRLNTIKKVATALLAYKQTLKSYPQATSFTELALILKPYLQVATNWRDPVDVAPFVYGYELDQITQVFSLTYYSETQKQLIRYTQDQAIKDQASVDMGARDGQRTDDLSKIRSALLIYSATVSNQNQTFVFPSQAEYKTKIAPQYIQQVPKDPKTGQDYEYILGVGGSSFVLKTLFELAEPGTSGYICSQDECKNF